MNIINLAEWLARPKKRELNHLDLERMAAECECTPYEALAALFAGNDAELGRAFKRLFCSGSTAPGSTSRRPKSKSVTPHPKTSRRQFGRELERVRLQQQLSKQDFGAQLGLKNGYHMAIMGRWLPRPGHKAYDKLVALGINPDNYR